MHPPSKRAPAQIYKELKVSVFAENFRRLLKEKGFTAKAFAVKMHKPANTISRWHTGKFLPRPEEIVHIAKLLKVDLSELYSNRLATVAPQIALSAAGQNTMEIQYSNSIAVKVFNSDVLVFDTANNKEKPYNPDITFRVILKQV